MTRTANTATKATVSATAVTTTTIEEVEAMSASKAKYNSYVVKGWKKSKADGTKTMPDVKISLIRAKSSDVILVSTKCYIAKPYLEYVRVSAMGCSFDVTVNKSNPDKLYFICSRDYDDEFEEIASEVKKAPVKACEKFIRERLVKNNIQSFDDLLVLALKANGLKMLNDTLYLA